MIFLDSSLDSPLALPVVRRFRRSGRQPYSELCGRQCSGAFRCAAGRAASRNLSGIFGHLGVRAVEGVLRIRLSLEWASQAERLATEPTRA